MACYRVFTRTWWKHNASWPDGREPSIGRKTVIARHVYSEESARDMCRVYNANHEPGKLSRKAEYESV